MSDLNPYPDMSETYNSTSKAMRAIRGAAAKKVAKKAAAKVAAPAAKAVAGKAAGAVAKAGMLGKLAKLATFGGGPIGTLGSIAAWTVVPMVLDRLLHGSEEDQMRHQMEMQARLAGGDAGSVGGVPGAGQVAAQYEEPRMADLIADRDMTMRMRDLGRADRSLQRSFARPSGTSELENLIAGDEVRMRQLQSPRILTPYEIMSAIDG